MAADQSTHTYGDGEEVVLWLNKNWAVPQPQERGRVLLAAILQATRETCTKRSATGSVGEVLEGNELVKSGMTMYFGRNQKHTVLCEETLTEKDASVFRYAVSQHYWYQMYLDDLPIWAWWARSWAMKTKLRAMEASGETVHQVRDAYLYTGKHLSIAYNEKSGH